MGLVIPFTSEFVGFVVVVADAFCTSHKSSAKLLLSSKMNAFMYLVMFVL